MRSRQAQAPRRPTRAQARQRIIRRTSLARRLVQAGVAVLIVVAAVRHQWEKDSGAASVDALCPFGAVETLLTWLVGGTMITKTHSSNFVLGVAVLAGVLLVGNAFCGWICPMGTVQDAMWRLGRWLHLPQLRLSERLDRGLRGGRFVVLGVVVAMSFVTGQLWFADYDPYVTIFGLLWIFEPSEGLLWGLVITAVVLAASLVLERVWCRYLCPLGAVFTVLGRFSFLRIRRNAATCTDCTLCDRPCPVGVTVSKADPLVHPDCIGCLDCVTTCPVKGALAVSAPVFVGDLLGRGQPAPASRPNRVRTGAGES